MSRNPAPSTLPEAAATDRIHLEGLSFEGRHGYFKAERAVSRPFRVDLIVALDLQRPAQTDQLSDTLDYNGLAKTVRDVVGGPSFRLIERLAGAIAEALLTDHPVEAVQVTVHKPTPDVVGSPTAAAVTLYRHRS